MGRVNHTAVVVHFTTFKHAVLQHYKTKMDLPGGVQKALDDMQAEVDVLLKTWSIMAGRNFMSDLMRKLMALEASLAGGAKQAALDFKTMLGKRLEQHNPGKSRYDSVLCIGYRAKTAGGSFSGATADYTDMAAKCDDMIDAIKKAHACVEPAHKTDGRMLKIFMAPEFFFRGANGGYAIDDVSIDVKDERGPTPKKSLLTRMKEVIDADLYKDWLFVLGTVIVVTKSAAHVCASGCKAGVQFERQSDNTTKPVCKADRTHIVQETVAKAAVDNVAYICKEKFVHTVSKELVSSIDFVTDRSLGIKDVVNVKGDVMEIERHKIAGNRYTAAAEQKAGSITDERMGGTIFTMDGINFACEVCLDHAASASDEKKGRGNDHAGDIQIQLIPSAGMNVSQFRTVPYGVVFNVDGGTPHVQVVGLTTALSPVLKAVQSYQGAEQTATHPDWNEKAMAAELEIFSKGKANPAWVTASDRVAASGTRGAVVQFGPFEIPAL